MRALLLLLLLLLLLTSGTHAFLLAPIPYHHHHHHHTHHRHALERLWEPPPPPPPPEDPSQPCNLSAALPDLLGSRSLGLDWGSKKIGMALSAGFSERPLGTIPNPAGHSINATRHRPLIDHILTMLLAEGAVRIVVGHPLFRDGTLSPQANATKAFARLLADRALEKGVVSSPDVPFVYLWDERLTSQAAKVNIKTKAFLHSSADIDSQAACLVLQDFYENKAHKAEIVWANPAVLEGRAARAGGVKVATTTLPPEVSNTVRTGGTRAGMSYDEWRKAELERYGRSSSTAGQPRASDLDDEGAKKKKKKKKKK